MGHHIEILRQEFSRPNYAIGLPAGSSLREPINRTLLRQTSTPAWQETLFKFLGN